MTTSVWAVLRAGCVTAGGGMAGAVMAVGAAVACPVQADLATGIRFAVGETETETFRQTAPGIVQSLLVDDYGTGFRNLLAQGVYLTEWVDILDTGPDMSTRSVYAFAMTPTEMPLPVPGGQANLAVAVFNTDSPVEQEMQKYSFGAETRISFDTCTYRMIPIEVRYTPDNDRGVDTLHYLPELGLAYFASSNINGVVEAYDYHSIEVVK